MRIVQDALDSSYLFYKSSAVIQPSWVHVYSRHIIRKEQQN